MNDIDREEHRLAALAAGLWYRKESRNLNTDGGTTTVRNCINIKGTWVAWNPKTNKADSFDLLLAIYDAEDSIQWADIDDILISKKSTEEKMACLFSVVVAIGRSMEASNERLGG